MNVLRILTDKKKGVVFLTASHFLNITVAFFTLPVLLLNLPASHYGQWQFILALQTLGLAISAPHIITAAKRGIALGKEGTLLFAILERAKRLIFTALFFVLLTLFFYLTDRIMLASLSAISIIYVFTNILLQSAIKEYFIGKEEFFLHSLWDTFSGPLPRIGSALIATFTHAIVPVVIFQTFYSLFISSFYGFYLLTKRGIYRQYQRGEVDRSCAVFGTKVIFTDLISASAHKAIEILLGIFVGFSTLAYFSVAKELRNQIANFLKMIQPLYYTKFARQPLEELLNKLRKRLTHAFLLGAFLTFCAGWLGIGYILIFLPLEYRASLSIFGILMGGLPALIPILLLSTALNAHLRYRALTLVSILGDLLTLLLVLTLGTPFGIMGMAFAMTLMDYGNYLLYFWVITQKKMIKDLFMRHALFRAVVKWY